MELPERVLSHLSSTASPVDSLALSREWGLDHQKVVGAVKSLQCLDRVVAVQEKADKSWELSAEGKEVANKGSHEYLAYCAIPQSGGIAQQDLMKTVSKVGFSKAMSAGWISIDKSGGKPMVVRKVEQAQDKVKSDLLAIRDGNGDKVGDKDKAEYKKRKLLQEVQVKSYLLSKGEKFTTKVLKGETDLTADMLASGAWKTASFKEYNFDALGAPPPAGHLHPLLKVRAEYRQIFLEMGFTEMPTNNYVESSFWNFDALFVPQKHPARDAQDTFFVSNPASAHSFPEEYKDKVSKVHYEGGYGSQGYGVWSDDETRKNTLRTHTTAVSARMLHALAQQPEFRPAKYFSIDRVFRNETLDNTHLAEFHQIEGVIADWDMSLGDLIGVLYEFFSKLGIEKLKFKPATNPYTEPSMEVFSYHEGLKKWVEIGNSGVFRPEMLLPMGLPEGVNVLGYGLSLERPTMIKYGIDNIRDLCGNKINLKMVQDNPICRLDKDTKDPVSTLARVTERRWEDIQSRLDAIAARLDGQARTLGISIQKDRLKEPTGGSRTIVIRADPSRPPYFIQTFVQELVVKSKVTATTHAHSSVRRLDAALADFLDVNPDLSSSEAEVSVKLIWKQGGLLPRLTVEEEGIDIHGKIAIAQYFGRNSEVAAYPDGKMDPRQCASLDAALDVVLSLDESDNLEKRLESVLAGQKAKLWVDGSDSPVSLPGLLLHSWQKGQHRKSLRFGPNFKRWLKQFSSHKMSKSKC